MKRAPTLIIGPNLVFLAPTKKGLSSPIIKCKILLASNHMALLHNQPLLCTSISSHHFAGQHCSSISGQSAHHCCSTVLLITTALHCCSSISGLSAHHSCSKCQPAFCCESIPFCCRCIIAINSLHCWGHHPYSMKLCWCQKLLIKYAQLSIHEDRYVFNKTSSVISPYSIILYIIRSTTLPTVLNQDP